MSAIAVRYGTSINDATKAMEDLARAFSSFNDVIKPIEDPASAISSFYIPDQFNESEKWRCKYCNSVNDHDDNNCPHCGAVGSQLI